MPCRYNRTCASVFKAEDAPTWAYDNVEVYHASPHGMVPKGILAGREELTESLLPALRLRMGELFAA